MFPIIYSILIAATLTAPPDAPILVGKEATPALQQIAMKLQILDERESKWILVDRHGYNEESLQRDIRMMRVRYQELKTAPPVEDTLYFPPPEIIQKMMDFNRAYRNYAQLNLAMYPDSYGARHDFWADAVKEADQLWRIYNNVKEAKCQFYTTYAKRSALKKVLEELGPEAYYSYTLPPCVPLWRFRLID